MKVFKRILCICLSIVFLTNFVACSDDTERGSSTVNNGSNNNSSRNEGNPLKPDTDTNSSMIEGEPEISKEEEFTMPQGAFGAKDAPILTQATRNVKAGDSVVVTGKGLSQKGLKAYVYAKGADGECKAHECKYQTVKDNEIAIVTDKNIKHGILAVYVATQKGNSNILLVNDPIIRWISTTAVTKDDTLSIYGENLTDESTDKTAVFLSRDGKYCTPEIIEKNPYKITIKIPETLEEGKEYEVSLNCGYGGDYGIVKAEEKIKFVKKKVNDFSAGKTINVVDYGANPADDGADDAPAIRAAINAAKDGDTIYFPNGTYVINSTIKTYTALKFKGESKKGVNIVAGKSCPEKLFDARGAFSEFCDLSFTEIQETEKLQTTFIYYNGSGLLKDYCEINVHDCYFYQESSKKSKSVKCAVAFIGACNSVFENNESLVTMVLWTNGNKKFYFRNNTLHGNMWTGSEYNQNSTLFWRTDMCDVSNNEIISRDALTDKTQILGDNDRTAGRSIVFQGYLKKGYIAENKMVETGAPDTNCGEQILIETGSLMDFKVPVSATETTVTFSNDFQFTCNSVWMRTLSVGDTVSVVHGDGAGQYRTITKIEGKTLTVDKPWVIIPNKTSIVGVTKGGDHIVIYKNDISGYKNYAENPGATCGVSTSGPSFNLQIVDNRFANMPVGIFMSHKYRTPTGSEPITMIQYLSIISGNTIENICRGIRYELYHTIPQPTMEGEEIYLNIGSTCRRNTIRNVSDYASKYWAGLGGQAINLGTTSKPLNQPEGPTWIGDWLYGIVFENMTMENCYKNICLLKHQGNNIFRNVTADKGDLFVQSSKGGEPIIFND